MSCFLFSRAHSFVRLLVRDRERDRSAPEAVQSLRCAVRARQRALGFASVETQKAAELLAQAEAKLNHEMLGEYYSKCLVSGTNNVAILGQVPHSNGPPLNLKSAGGCQFQCGYKEGPKPAGL